MLRGDVRDRIGKLIPLLASDKDGEVVAAARAIERALRAGGFDLHTLSTVLTGSRTGWTPAGKQQTAQSTERFNYADTFEEAAPLFEGPEPPDALTRRFGLPIYTAKQIEPWYEVARHCLLLNRTVPKKHGGRFLEDWQIALLKTFKVDWRQPTNRHVEWLEKTIARLHQARDRAARAAKP